MANPHSRTTQRLVLIVCFLVAAFTVMNAQMGGLLTQQAAGKLDLWDRAEEALLFADSFSPAAGDSSNNTAVNRQQQEQQKKPSDRKAAARTKNMAQQTPQKSAAAATAAAAEPPTPYPNRLFLKGEEMTGKDIFSASWWQRIDRFLDFDAEKLLMIVEDDSFKPILKAGRGHSDVRMARDLLDFCVEHLSKWWKDAGGDTLTYARELLSSYTQRIRSQSGPQDEFMNTTLAVIPYGVKDNSSDEVQLLWGNALAATMTALLNHGVARIVVVGYYKADEILARKVFEMLSRNESRWLQSSADGLHFETVVGNAEIAFVHTNNVKSTYIRYNIPKGALVGLQDAFAGRSNDPASYLGATKNAADRFRYVFLTEADQILNARITPKFIAEMEDGRIIVPHRMQPMPHPDDLRGLRLSDSMKSLPGHKVVMPLDAASDACCDTGYHQENYGKVCQMHWFRCGFSEKNASFRHLDEYDFISLLHGTGVVTLAGNQHSRKCQPVKNGRGKC